jgi:hypothetical protein
MFLVRFANLTLATELARHPRASVKFTSLDRFAAKSERLDARRFPHGCEVLLLHCGGAA